MLRFLADENSDRHIVKGLIRRQRDIDVLRVQDLRMAGADDARVLEWAAEDGRVLLTHDARTMPRYAYERVGAGEPMPGVFIVSGSATIGDVVEDLLLVARCSLEAEWEGRVTYVPLR